MFTVRELRLSCVSQTGIPLGFLLILARVFGTWPEGNLCPKMNAARARKDGFSRAVSLVYSGYKPERCYWLVVEKVQPVVLVGILQLFWPGSLTQIGLALLYSIMHCCLLLRVWPYKSHWRNNLAAATSMSLIGLFFSAAFLRVSSLTEESTIKERMSNEQVDAFDTPANMIVLLTFACVGGVLVISAAVSMAQMSEEQQLLTQITLAKSSRRLRHSASNRQVFAPLLEPGHFHLFLSHVWSTAQDQMRLVKQQLHELVPNLRVFLGARLDRILTRAPHSDRGRLRQLTDGGSVRLSRTCSNPVLADVDDLKSGKGAESVDISLSTLVMISDGYFNSPNCALCLGLTAT